MRNVTRTRTNIHSVFLSSRIVLRLISKWPKYAINAKNIALTTDEIRHIDMIGIFTNTFSRKVYWIPRQIETMSAYTSRMRVKIYNKYFFFYLRRFFSFFLRLARARPYFCLPAAKVGKTASSIAVLDTYIIDIDSKYEPWADITIDLKIKNFTSFLIFFRNLFLFCLYHDI